MAVKQFTQSVLFIHGLFVNYQCWDDWVAHFMAKGYLPTAQPWPGRDKTIAELRRGRDDAFLGRLTLSEVIEAHVDVIHNMPEPPILIGHSLGGLIVQILLNRGLGAAGVAIDSAPPQGVFTTAWSFLRCNWPLINPTIAASEPYRMSLPEWQYAFTNGLPADIQRESYENSVAPESRRVARGTLSAAAKVDFGLPHAPLLFIAGGADHIIPPSLNRANYTRYRASSSQTDLIEFPGRTHYLLRQQGWQEIADSIIQWLGQ